MKTSIQKMIVSSAMALFAISTAMAQHHAMWDIIPASKGSLPVPQEIPGPAEGRFPGLTLEKVDYSHHTGAIVNGYWMNLDAYEPYMPVFYPETFGGDYYTLQYRTKSSGVWKTYTDDNGNPVQYSGRISALCPEISEDTDYRLKLHGGPMDGYLSNEVSAKMPTVNYSVITRRYVSQPNFITPGVKVEGALIDAERQDRGHLEDYEAKYNTLASFGYDSSCYRHQWYRRNPKTYDMEPIAGATELDYTPTVEDVGYELVDVTTGDDINISFYAASNHGIVSVAIGAAIEYIGDDGFVLNTDYDIPEPEKNIILNRYDDATGTEIEAPFGNALEKRKPGQYAIKMNVDFFRYGQLLYADETYNLSFVYKSPIYDDNNEISGYEPWYHFPMIEPEAFYRMLQIKPLFNGVPLATTVDILGKNIDGKLVTVKTLEAEELTDGTMTTDVYKGKYYVKAHQTESTTDTYYPNALIWSEAGIVEPEAENWEIENWQPTCATINIVETPAPLQGSSVIEGTITLQATAGNARTRGDGDMTYTVYLIDESTGKMIAQTQTDAKGHYKFENVPVGNYIIVPSVDGFKAAASSPVEVQVTQANQTITNANCALIEASESEILHESTMLTGDAFEDGTIDTKDIAAIAEYLLGKNPENFNKNNADANNDGTINAADIVEIVNIIKANK
jgi:hypothetical protein